MRNYKNILLKISVMNVLCCLSLGVIKPCQVNAEGEFTETFWIQDESLSAYNFFQGGLNAVPAADGDYLSIDGSFNGTLNEITLTSGSSSISLSGEEILTSSGLTAYSTFLSQNPNTPIVTNYRLGTSNNSQAEISCAEVQSVNGLTTYDGEAFPNYVNQNACTVTMNYTAANERLYLMPDQLKVTTEILGAVYDDEGNLLEGGAITLHGRNAETGSEAFSLTSNSSGSFSGTISLSTEGSWQYQYPWLKFDSNMPDSLHTYSNQYPQLRFGSNGKYYLAIVWWNADNYSFNFSKLTTFYNNDAGVYAIDSNGNYIDVVPTYYDYQYSRTRQQYIKVLYELNKPTGVSWFNLYFNNSTSFSYNGGSAKSTPRLLYFAPLYMGDGMNIGDDFRRFIGLSDRLLDELGKTRLLIQNGTTASQAASGGLDNQVGGFSDVSDDLISAEDAALEDMDTALGGINTSNIIGQLGSFNSANRWVVQQFEALTVDNPVGIFISVSLVLALAAVLVGRL